MTQAATTRDNPARASAPVLEAEGVGLRLHDRRILEGIKLKVNRGEILAIMGMSGSGKTTLLKCLAGLLRPTEGAIWLEGQNLATLPEPDLERARLKIGLVFQYAALFDSLTVRENVAFGLAHNRRLSKRELDEIVALRLADVQMSGTEDLLPSQLSGGMQKRVGLARALAMEPSILLYDEPTSGLDPVIARSIDDLIVQTRDHLGMTSVVVSHDIRSILRIADRVAMLHEGRLVASGTVEEVRASTVPIVRSFLDDETESRSAESRTGGC